MRDGVSSAGKGLSHITPHWSQAEKTASASARRVQMRSHRRTKVFHFASRRRPHAPALDNRARGDRVPVRNCLRLMRPKSALLARKVSWKLHLSRFNLVYAELHEKCSLASLRGLKLNYDETRQKRVNWSWEMPILRSSLLKWICDDAESHLMACAHNIGLNWQI